MIDQNGFSYELHSGNRINKAYWRCNLARKVTIKCPARTVTYCDKITHFTGIHNHMPDVPNS